jgi:hypothetical protein
MASSGNDQIVPIAPTLSNMQFPHPIPPQGMVPNVVPQPLPFMPPVPPTFMPPFMPPPMPMNLQLPTGLPILPPKFPSLQPLNKNMSDQRVTDPNNDVTCWSEYKDTHGRRYWHNIATMQSTYDKPFCLKTPEERSIPPCPWKEYVTPEGKFYYSNGTDSR